jgi:hypothetical protein
VDRIDAIEKTWQRNSRRSLTRARNGLALAHALESGRM